MGASKKSSSTRTSIFAMRASVAPYAPEARATASSSVRRGTRVKSARSPFLHAASASAEAR